MVEVPLDGFLQKCVEVHVWRPAESRQFRRVDAVTGVVERTVLHVLDPVIGRAWHVHDATHLDGELGDGDFEVSSDVVDLVEFALVEDDVEGADDIACVEEVPETVTGTVNAALPSGIEEMNEFRNDLFWELVWTEDVISAGDNDWHVEGLDVSLAHEFGTGF